VNLYHAPEPRLRLRRYHFALNILETLNHECPNLVVGYIPSRSRRRNDRNAPDVPLAACFAELEKARGHPAEYLLRLTSDDEIGLAGPKYRRILEDLPGVEAR
jgi:hypothetical protein